MDLRPDPSPIDLSRRHRIGSLILCVEWALALLLTGAVVVAHISNLRHAGALWRDEVNTVDVADRPSFGDFLYYSSWESFPRLWPFLLRQLIAAGVTSDFGLRIIGCIVGALVLGSLWWNSRYCWHSVPLCSLVLLGFSVTVLKYGDSLRAYGLGAVLLVVNLGLAVRLIQRPTWRTTAWAALIAVLGVNTLYYNSLLLFAMCVGATVVELRHRDGQRFLKFLTVGLIALASLGLSPSMHLRNGSKFGEQVQVPVNISWFAARFSEAVNFSGEFMIWVWVTIFCLSIVAGVCRYPRPNAEWKSCDQDMAVFLVTTLIVGFASYTLFLLRLSYPTEPWYYIAAMTFLAVVCEGLVQLYVGDRLVPRIVRIGCCGAVALLALEPLMKAAHVRHTNLDTVAARLALLAEKDDFVLVVPCWPGISFSRYYHGPAPWTTLPEISDHLVHRLDLAREKMAERDPIRSVQQKVTDTLQSGHRVWVVGGLPAPKPGSLPIRLPPAPHGPDGWYEGAYYDSWAEQIGYLMQKHARRYRNVAVPTGGPVSVYETMPLIEFDGWR